MIRLFWELRLTAILCLFAICAPAEYRKALSGYRYSFPRDHYEHADFRTEWWYYTGNVFDKAGNRFGFELVFFRQGVKQESDNKSAWDVHDLYLAHAALTDVSGKHFWYEERLNRQGPGIAGASFEQRRIWNGNWQANENLLEAITSQFRFHLNIAPAKPFVIHGENGVSQKAAGAGNASHYVSYTRLSVKGTVNARDVTGQAWMDHEWFTEQLSADQIGWDWFSIQLDNKTELMLFQLRRKDGIIDSYSAGTFVDADGKARKLSKGDFTLEPAEYEGKYPVVWRVRIPSLAVDITCRAALRNQELRSKRGPSYWEGAVDYSGSHKGVGYLEMTGYEAPVRLQ